MGSVAAVSHGRYTFSAKMASSQDPRNPGDEASRIDATCYAPIWTMHVHAREFLEVVVGVTCRQLSLTREPEVC